MGTGNSEEQNFSEEVIHLRRRARLDDLEKHASTDAGGALFAEPEARAGGGIPGDIPLLEHALDIASEGFTISDATRPDNPLIYVNKGFERLTGYSRTEVLGRNCRFLQGPATNDVARAEIRQAITEQRDCVVELLNHRKDGTPFWNRLSITPVRDAAGRVRHFIGVQSDITDHVTAEERLQTMATELQDANARLNANVNAAAKVQRAMLPEPDIRVPGADFAWRYQPCEGLAGDLLNVFRLDEDHAGFYVLDVSGHGTAAALMAVAVNRLLLPTVSASSLVKRQRSKDGAYDIVSPAKVADELNKTFPWEAETGQFFTIVYAVLNCRTRELRYVSAGHPGFVHVPPSGQARISASADLPVGLQRGDYHEHMLRLEPGARVYLYSDGVTECADPAGNLFGEQRLCSALEEHRRIALDASLEELLHHLGAWRRGAPPRDDISLLGCQLPV